MPLDFKPLYTSRSTLCRGAGFTEVELLADDHAHVWPIDLESFDQTHSSSLLSSLSSAELERARRFHFEKDRLRFLTAHGFVRAILSKYTHRSPRSLEFNFNESGKPFLAGRFAPSGPHFNLSHSSTMAVLAVARKPVGIDIERIRPIDGVDRLVASFFSPRESVTFSQLHCDLKLRAFLSLWTRKEAWLKATGKGITELLDQVEVGFAPNENACFKSLPAGFHLDEWCVEDLTLAPGFIAALVLQNRKAHVIIRDSTTLFTNSAL